MWMIVRCEYNVCHKVLYFLLYLDCEKLYDVVELYDKVDVGKYICVEWLWYSWWIHICYLIVILLVNAYMLSDGDFVGDYIYGKWLIMVWWWLLIELWLDWFCGRKYLIMQLLLKLINVNGGVLLHCCWWIFML